MKKVQVIGNVTADAEIKEFAGGKKVINFDVAVNESYKNAKGEKVQSTTYVKCAMWRENTSVAQYIKKGMKIYVEGSPEADAYVKNSEAVAVLKINVSEVEFLSAKKVTEPA